MNVNAMCIDARTFLAETMIIFFENNISPSLSSVQLAARKLC